MARSLHTHLKQAQKVWPFLLQGDGTACGARTGLGFGPEISSKNIQVVHAPISYNLNIHLRWCKLFLKSKKDTINYKGRVHEREFDQRFLEYTFVLMMLGARKSRKATRTRSYTAVHWKGL